MLLGGLLAAWPPPRTQRKRQEVAVPEAVRTS
jgi:hypothetical protein